VGSNQQERLALIQGEFCQGCTEVLEIEMALLIRVRFEASRKSPILILHLPLALAVLGVEKIAQDRKEPCVQISAAFKAVDVGLGPHDGVLHQIICSVGMVGQGDGKGP
jgi:hypothetical protein